MQESWISVSISLNSIESDEIELLTHALFMAGALGVEVEDQHYLNNTPNWYGEIRLAPTQQDETKVKAYFDSEIDEAALLSTMQNWLPHRDISCVLDEIKNDNWQENWMVHYQPERMSRYLTVVPVWSDYQPTQGEHTILLDPGMAFGTGNHPTTRLGAQALELYMRGGEDVLDVGTGSGILAFAAAIHGANSVKGMDLDIEAVENAKANFEQQKKRQDIDGVIFNTTPIEFFTNDLLNGIEEKVDIIVANILPHILIHLFDDAKRLLNPGGYLILGGILQEKSAFIEDALQQHQFSIVQKNQLGEWVGYVVQPSLVDE